MPPARRCSSSSASDQPSSAPWSPACRLRQPLKPAVARATASGNATRQPTAQPEWAGPNFPERRSDQIDMALPPLGRSALPWICPAGAQTGRRGEVGPVRASPGGQDLTVHLLFQPTVPDPQGSPGKAQGG